MATPFTGKLKIGIIQMRPKPLDPEHNFAHAVSQIRAAASQGAQIAVLPEYHLTAWEPDDPAFVAICRTAAKYQHGYAELAAQLHIYICTGTIVQTADTAVTTNGTDSTTSSLATDDRPTLLNISAFIDPSGTVLDTYIKTNIWIPERAHLTSSVAHAQTIQNETHPQPHRVIPTPFGPLGILVCWDLAFPEAFRSLVRQGARIILVPTFWTALDMSDEGLQYNKAAEKLFLESSLVARAFENTAAIVFVNAGGPVDKGYLGLSGAYLPIVGRVEGSFDNAEEGMRVVELDMEILEVAERNYKIRQDMAKDDWHYGYAHA